MGEYLLPAEKEEIEKLKPELEKQTNYTPRTMKEVITAHSLEHAKEDKERDSDNLEKQESIERGKGAIEKAAKKENLEHPRGRNARTRKPPDRLQMPDWRR